MNDEGHLSEAQVNMYLDGALPEEEQVQVEAHLAGCARCRAEVAALRQLFAALEELAPQPDLVPAVLAQIGRRRSPLGWVGRLVPALQAVLSLGLLVWGGLWLARHHPLAAWWQGPWGRLWPEGALASTWAAVTAWAAGLGPWFAGRGAALWAGLRDWATGWNPPPLPFSPLGPALTLLVVWLAGNALLLRHVAWNRQAVFSKRRR